MTIKPSLILHQFLDLVYPRRCAICEKALTALGEIGLCSFCFGAVKKSLAFIVHRPPEEAFFETAYAAFNYDGLIRKCIHSFKYKRRRDLAKPLSGFLIQAAKTAPFTEKSDIVIPVPLHSSRLAERGYNQSVLLAEGLSRGCGSVHEGGCGIKLSSENLIRIKKGADQVDLARDERLHNVNGAFRLKDPYQIKNRKIIIVDDIMTTGATINECARVLREAGAASVNTIVLAMGT